MFGLTIPEFTRAGQYKLDIMRILTSRSKNSKTGCPSCDQLPVCPHPATSHDLLHEPNSLRCLSSLPIASQRLVRLHHGDRRQGFACPFALFAPTVGINEDPVTVRPNGPLGVYLFERGKWRRPAGSCRSLASREMSSVGKGGLRFRLLVQGTAVTSVQHRWARGDRSRRRKCSSADDSIPITRLPQGSPPCSIVNSRRYSFRVRGRSGADRSIAVRFCMSFSSLFFGLVLCAAFTLFGWNVRRLGGYLALGKKENRFDHPGKRIGRVLSIAFGQFVAREVLIARCLLPQRESCARW